MAKKRIPRTEAEFKIILPKFDNSGNPIKIDKIKAVSGKLSDRFGGVTITPTVLGCWHDKEMEELLCEQNVELIAVRDCGTISNKRCRVMIDKDKSFMRSLAKEVGNDLGQASIFLQHDIVRDNIFVKGTFKKMIPPKDRRRYTEDWFGKIL